MYSIVDFAWDTGFEMQIFDAQGQRVFWSDGSQTLTQVIAIHAQYGIAFDAGNYSDISAKWR